MNQATADRQMLTVIMPARNEEANLPRAYDEVTAVMAGLDCDYEVLVIDNASTDNTGAVAAELCARDPRWRYLRFSRDFQKYECDFAIDGGTHGRKLENSPSFFSHQRRGCGSTE